MSDNNGNGFIDLDDLAPIAVKYRIGGKQYVLREASADAAVQYRNAITRASRLTEDGKVATVEGLHDAEPLLVSLCLYQAKEDGTDTNVRVPIDTIRKWTNRIQRTLFDKIMEISDLNEQSEEALERRIAFLQKSLARVREENERRSKGNPPVPSLPTVASSG